MNSSPVAMPSRAAGISDAVCTEMKDWRDGNIDGGPEGADDINRDKMVSFRATSKPFKSSAGWGSWF